MRAYHIDSKLKDPIKMVQEFVTRIFYELLIGKITPSQVMRGTWMYSSGRDRNHQQRIRNLVWRIRKSGVARNYLKNYKWISLTS